MDSGFDKIPIGWFQKKKSELMSKKVLQVLWTSPHSLFTVLSAGSKKGREMEGVLSSPQKRMFTANSKGQKRSLWLVIRGH